jgi:hypothetical protein
MKTFDYETAEGHAIDSTTRILLEARNTTELHFGEIAAKTNHALVMSVAHLLAANVANAIRLQQLESN